MTDVLAKADVAFSKVYPDYKKFFNYLLVGVIATLADMGSLFVLNDFMNLFYLYANICSYTLGMVISFYLNKYYNFKNTYKKVHYQFISFALVAVTGLVLNTALMYVFVHHLFSNDTSMFVMVSKLIATFIVFIWNFFINKSVTFKVFQ